MAETLVTELFGDTAVRRQTRLRSEEEFQPRRTVAALSSAAVATALCATAAAEIVARRHGMHAVPPEFVDALAARLRATPWADPSVGFAGWGLLLGGIALLAHAVWPAREALEPMRGADPALSAALSRDALARSVENAARGVPGVTGAQARIGRRIDLEVATGYRNPGNLADLVRRAVVSRLGEIDPVRDRALALSVVWRR
ncbi:DUF6286 domain-containing protein [Actinocorallia sp. A-T 12471]|uniref:DUF6286 domain-containing protein n=1 Tax=Actinocorallia sp. A-T 12471 TaxID=3089813 RepID=UPI0029CB8BCD|nr:DUF6286 domain-containing protein [Actinocorallia sp. A-T 12471]MDX6743663.1 DUF6286 domain-containing protein [Actinocorallia sp. A-T 12471]